jgi:hypothetical protein
VRGSALHDPCSDNESSLGSRWALRLGPEVLSPWSWLGSCGSRRRRSFIGDGYRCCHGSARLRSSASSGNLCISPTASARLLLCAPSWGLRISLLKYLKSLSCWRTGTSQTGSPGQSGRKRSIFSRLPGEKAAWQIGLASIILRQ